MSFGADIGAILRSGIAPLQKLMVIAVRYHHPDGAPACRLVEISGMGRSTAFRTLDQLRDAGWVDGRDGRWTYAGEPIPNKSRSGTLPVPERDSPVPERDSPVPERDSPPSPPNKVLETFSRPSPDLVAGAHVHEGPGLGDLATLDEHLTAWMRTQARSQGGLGPGLMASGAAVSTMCELLKAHGPGRLAWAIQAAAEKTNRGAPNLGFLRMLCVEGPRVEAAQAPQHGYGGRRAPQSPFRNDDAPPAGPRPVDPASGDVDF